MHCRNCGLTNVPDARFCVRCGVPIAAAAMATGMPYPPPRATEEEVTQPYASPRPYHAPSYQAYPPPMAPTQRGMYHQPVHPGQAAGNPAVATILSVIVPGLGQLYNSDTKKGLIMFGIAFVGLFLFGLGWLAMMIWSGIDAFQVASGTGRRWS